MDSHRVNRWLTLGANIGVLIGIILLVVQLNQNRDMMRAQTRSQLSTGIVDLLSSVANNQQLASVRRRADLGEDLTPDEKYQYSLLTRSTFRYWENVHYQFRQGLYDELEFSRQKYSWQDYLEKSETLSEYWCDTRLEYSVEFMAEMDGLLARYKC